MDREGPADVYRRLSAAFTAVVDAVPEPAWGRPSPCAGWSARDVLAHVAATEADFVRQRGLDLPDGPDPQQQPRAAWAHVRPAIQAVLDDPDRAGFGYQGMFGPTTIGESIADFHCVDLIVHRWDIARAVGGDTSLTAEEIAYVRGRFGGYGDMMRMPGAFGPELPAPPGADDQTTLLAFLGRAG